MARERPERMPSQSPGIVGQSAQDADVGNGPLRLVVVTRGSRYAARVVEAVRDRGIDLCAVVLERPRGRSLFARLTEVWRRRGPIGFAGALFRQSLSRLGLRSEPWRARIFYEAFGAVHVVEALQSESTASLLTELAPDVLILAGAPILPDAVLSTARLGVLNAHPGLLPRYRGVDVVGHAILEGQQVGATVHFVDAGIDTGRIISRVVVSTAGASTLAALQDRVERVGAVAMAAVLERLCRDGAVPSEMQQERFPLYRSLSRRQRRLVNAKLVGGE